VVSVILNRPRVPNLQVDINGKRGLFYFHRKVSYYPGDGGVDSPIYGGDQIEIALPEATLVRGENRLVLTAVDDPKDGPGDSWLLYDALRLVEDPDAKASSQPEVSIEPTVFYVDRDGGLAELAEVTVTHSRPVQHGDVTLTVAGKSFKEAVKQAHDFGEERIDFAVPELRRSPRRAKLQIAAELCAAAQVDH
jgi:hypothetical protein